MAGRYNRRRRSSFAIWLPYIVISIVEIIARGFGNETITKICNPLLMPSILVATMVYLKNNDSEHSFRVCAALVFYWIGDILLMFAGKGFFIGGMFAFMIGHLFMIDIFSERLERIGRRQEGGSKIIFNIAIIILTIGLFSLVDISHKIESGIILYAYALSWLTVTCFFCMIKGVRYSNLALFGAIFFIVSDGIIGLHVFNGIDFPFRNCLQTGTYALAVLLLVLGVVKAE